MACDAYVGRGHAHDKAAEPRLVVDVGQHLFDRGIYRRAGIRKKNARYLQVRGIYSRQVRSTRGIHKRKVLMGARYA